MFSVACEQHHGVHFVTVEGDIDIATAPRLRTQFRRCIEDDAVVVIVDLSALAFCDAQGINLFVAVHKQFRTLGRELRLVVPTSNALHKMLAICGLLSTLWVYADVSEAVAG